MEENNKKSVLDALLKRREMLNALFERRQSASFKRSVRENREETSDLVEKQETSELSVSSDHSDIIEDSDPEPPIKQKKIHTVILDSSNENINTSMVSLPLSHPFFGGSTPQNSIPVKIITNKKITILSDQIIKKSGHAYMTDLTSKQNTVSPLKPDPITQLSENTYINIIDTQHQVKVYEKPDTPPQNNCCSLNGVNSPSNNCKIEAPASLTCENKNTYPNNAVHPVNHVDELGSSAAENDEFDLNHADALEPGRLVPDNGDSYQNIETHCHHQDNIEITVAEIEYTNLETVTFSTNKTKADNNSVSNSIDASNMSHLVKPGCSKDINYMSVGMPSKNIHSENYKKQAKKHLKRKFLDFLSDDETGDYSAGSSDDWAEENESESSEGEITKPARKKRKLTKTGDRENDPIKRKEEVKTNKRKIIKIRRNEGKKYESSTGKQVKERQLKTNPCLPNKCKRGCYNISEERRAALFSFFWNLNVQRRKDWLVRLSHVVPVQRRRTDSPVTRRNITYEYYVNNGDDHQKVCQKFLLDTLDISQKNLLYTLSNSKDEMAKIDQRTRHIPNKYSDAAKINVRQYKDKLPAVPSHYTRPKSSKLYLPQELKNISNLYRLYLKECHSSNIEFVSESMFRSIFTSEYNMSFHTPKKDKCILCVKAEHDENLNEKDKKKLEDHLKEKLATYERFKVHQNLPNLNNDTIVCSFDLQKILNTPYGKSVVLYYSRKYPVFNFTLYESITQNVFCYLWGECDGKKGGNEIATCLYLYLKAVDERGVKNILFYCDSCGGQNKNKTVLSVFNYFLMHSKNLEVIQINYLLPGHTYMPVDSVHAIIEREVKKLIVWSPSQWPSYIEAAIKHPEPYNVVKMDHSDFYKWDEIVEETFSTETTKNVKIRNIRTVTLKKKNLNQIYLKYSMEEDTPTDTLTLFQKSENKGKVKRGSKQKGKGKTTKGKCIGEQTINRNAYEKVMVLSPSVLYPKQLPISEAKYRDLKRLCENGTIPKMYHRSYLDLPHGNVVDALIMTDEEDEVESDLET